MTTPAAESIGGIVNVRDPLAYIAGLACIVIACVLAAFVPAHRASRVEPMAALRHD